MIVSSAVHKIGKESKASVVASEHIPADELHKGLQDLINAKHQTDQNFLVTLAAWADVTLGQMKTLEKECGEKAIVIATGAV